MTIRQFPSATDDALADQAARWLMRVSDPAAGPDDHAACNAWRTADAAHERAWQQAVQFWRRDELALALAVAAEQAAAVQTGARRWRTAALAAVLLLTAVLGGVLMLPGVGSWLLADQQAPFYRLRQMTLPDGTRITLDAGSAADIDYSPSRRRIALRSGSVVVEAAHDPQRPLLVETARATVTVIGTRFLVAQQGGGRDRIAVQQGRVAVRNQAGIDVHLTAGQQIEADAVRLGRLESIDPNNVADFATGWRSFEAVPLKTVLAEIGRYRFAPILLADAGLGDLPVTARLQVSDPERALAALQGSLPLLIQGWPGGLLRIQRTHP